MGSAVLSVPLPADVKKQMDRHSEIKWVEVARKAIVEKLELLERMDALLAESQFTEKDAVRHGRKVNQGVLKRHR